MRREVIYSKRVARGDVPLAHAVKAGGFVFVSGIPPFHPDGSVDSGDFLAQMRQCLINLLTILADAGASISDVVKVNVYLSDRDNVAEMNSAYREVFGNEPGAWPARTTVVALLPRPDFLVEVECVAVSGEATD